MNTYCWLPSNFLNAKEYAEHKVHFVESSNHDRYDCREKVCSDNLMLTHDTIKNLTQNIT